MSVTNQDPNWYKDAIVYQTHIKAFRDGNGDGNGDFQGLIEKLDYIHDLGVTAICLPHDVRNRMTICSPPRAHRLLVPD